MAKLGDFHLGAGLDWEVVREPLELGGNQRLNASAIVRRKPGYFVRNYIVVIFLLTTSGFAAFLCKPDDLGSRTGISLTVLLSAVAFKYGGSDSMPTVSYSTYLDSYILFNIYIILLASVVVYAFSVVCSLGGTVKERLLIRGYVCSAKPGAIYKLAWIPPYNPVAETAASLLLTGAWLAYNAWFWRKIYRRVLFNVQVVEDVGLGWMNYKPAEPPPGPKGAFPSEQLILRKVDASRSGLLGWLRPQRFAPSAACARRLLGIKPVAPPPPPPLPKTMTFANVVVKSEFVIRGGDPNDSARVMQVAWRKRKMDLHRAFLERQEKKRLLDLAVPESK